MIEIPTNVQHQIKKRLFVVGCPRSGTTLLQTFLGAHPLVKAFPETQVLPIVVGHGRRWREYQKPNGILQYMHFLRSQILLKAGISYKPYVTSRIFQPMDSLGLSKEVFNSSWFLSRNINEFARYADEVAISEGKHIWSEKSPSHRHYTSVINKYISNSEIIHIIRPGIQTIASLKDAAGKYGDGWSIYNDIDICINCWNCAIEIAVKNISLPNYHIVYYDHLVDQPEATLKDLCRKINVSFEQKMIDGRCKEAGNVVLKTEAWKESNFSDLKRNEKSDQLFDEGTKKNILSRLIKIPNNPEKFGEINL